MISIQGTLLPNLINLNNSLSQLSIQIIILLYLLSLLFYFIAIILSLKSLSYNKFSSYPDLKGLCKVIDNDEIIDNVIITIIKNYDEVINENKTIMDQKIDYSRKGMKILLIGILFLILFIIFIIRGYLYVL